MYLFFIHLGVTYTRWGKKECPTGVDMVYTGNRKKRCMSEADAIILFP